jgi:hypothetical protein
MPGGFVEIDRGCGILEKASVTTCPDCARKSEDTGVLARPIPTITVLRRLKLGITKIREVSR